MATKPVIRVPYNTADRLTDLVTGLGTSKDPIYRAQYGTEFVNREQLNSAYRSNWIARKVVDIPALDATREWRTWQAEKDQIEKLEAEERRLGLQLKTMQALIRARLYGGAALIIGDGGNAAEPLRPETINRGGLKYLHVVNRWEMGSTQIVRDILSPWYGRPEFYQVNSETSGTVTVHASRVVRFLGNDLPDVNLSPDGWGDSVLMAADAAIKEAIATNANMAQLAFEAKVDVIKIPRMMESLATASYRDRLIERFTLANSAKSIANTLMLDSEEEWDQKQLNFAGLPDVIRVYLLIMTAAADIPATRFLGQSPAGFSATGESDTRNYYDRIKSDQMMHITPAMSVLDEVLIRSALGDRPEEIYYEWASLWQMSDKEKAEIAKLKADAFAIDVQAGLIADEALRKGRENQLIEDGTYPGFDQALEDAENAEPDEDDEDVRAEFEALKAAMQTPPVVDPESVTDAAPKTLYIRRDVMNGAEIAAWARAQGFDTVQDDLHVTIMHTRTPMDWIKVGADDEFRHDREFEIAPGGPRLMERFGDAVVLQFASSRLTWRHEDIKRLGAMTDYPEYQPHITISWGFEGDISQIEPYRGKIVLGPEIFEEVDDAWREKVSEE